MSIILTFNKPGLIHASTTQKPGKAPASNGDFTPVHGADYVDATNTFTDGDPLYYLATHDPDKESLTEIEYNGKTYPLQGVAVVPDSFDFSTQEASDGAKIFAHNGPSNITIFFDEGVYNDELTTHYTAFSRPNNSYVGLVNGTVTISRDPRTSPGVVDGLMERYLLYHKNLYFENLIFDGKNCDMVPVTYRDGSSYPKNRGEALIFINGSHNRGADGLVMRNIVIQNVGDGNHDNNMQYFWGWPLEGTMRKNVAINIIYNPGQVNLENITIQNVETDHYLGVVSVQDSSDTYLKNIYINMGAAPNDTVPIKVETTSGNVGAGPALDYPNHKTVMQNITVTNVADPAYDMIYVQDYRYNYVSVPDNYRFAAWNISNGHTSAPAFVVYKNLIPATNNIAIHDINDGYWVVDANSEDVSIEKQLSDILSVINYTDDNVPSAKAPRAYIKMYSSEEIPKFKVPDGYSEMEVHIVAVPTGSTLYSSTELVPTVSDIVITLPDTNSVTLYNFDFYANAKYTMYEAIEGITPLTLADLNDPADKAKGTYDFSGYPNYADYAPTDNVAAKVTNSTSNTFVNCKFVVLASEIEITDAPAELVVGKTSDLNHKFTESKTLDEELTSTADIDDDEVKWFSSDETIATVDSEGVVTPLAEGEVTIFLKAVDSYNNGEIEKPFDSITFKVVKRFNLITSVDGGNGTISESKTDLLKDSSETVTFTPNAGYEINKVTVNGVEVEVTGNSLTLVMDEDKEVVVSYKSNIIPPETGDNYPLYSSMAIAMLSLAGLIIVSNKKKSIKMKYNCK